MIITIVSEQSLLPESEPKSIEDLNSQDFDHRAIISRSDLVIAQKYGQVRVMKTRNYPYTKTVWDYEQLFRILYVVLEQAHHINLRQSILEMAKQLDPHELQKLLVDIEKLGFERT